MIDLAEAAKIILYIMKQVFSHGKYCHYYHY